MAYVRFALTCLVVLLVGSATRAAEAATTIYLQFDPASGIVGASTEKAHPKWVEVESYSMSPSAQAALATTGAGAPRREGPLSITVTVAADGSLPAVQRAAIQGKPIKSAALDVVKMSTSDGGRGESVRYALANVVVSSFSMKTSASGANRPIAVFVLNFAQIKVEYAPHDASGNRGTVQPLPAGWDLTTARRL